MPSREDNFEVAKLAKLVGSQLNMIDKFSLEKSNVPANRIDMNKFIAQVRNPDIAFRNTKGYVPEELVEKMVPDISEFSKPQIQNQPLPVPQPPQEVVSQPVAQAAIQIDTPPIQNNTPVSIPNNTNEIADFLSRIAASLEKLVDYYTSHNIIESDKKKILND